MKVEKSSWSQKRFNHFKLYIEWEEPKGSMIKSNLKVILESMHLSYRVCLLFKKSIIYMYHKSPKYPKKRVNLYYFKSVSGTLNFTDFAATCTYCCRKFQYGVESRRNKLFHIFSETFTCMSLHQISKMFGWSMFIHVLCRYCITVNK